MALDGITIAALVHELNQSLCQGRIYKITQPEPDELLLTIKNNGSQYRLALSANPSLPLVYLVPQGKVSPVTAPSFCMLLRKHIQNGRILSITQPDFERIIRIRIEHLNELGDVCEKNLIIELMGKYSNIIFTDETDLILDSIRHVSAAISSVREVLPGKQYFVPSQEKQNPLTADETAFTQAIKEKPAPCYKAIYTSFTGFSPMIAHEICHLAGSFTDCPAPDLTPDQQQLLYQAFLSVQTKILTNSFTPVILYENGLPIDYCCLQAASFLPEQQKQMPSVSELFSSYYSEKEKLTRSRQKSADLRKIVQTTLERTIKKYDLQLRQLQDTNKMEQFKLYGELLHTYGYSIEPGAKSAEVINYYDSEPLTIPLDSTLTPMENAKKYFDKYSKLKRTREALTTLTKEVKEEIDHLDSIATALDIAEHEEDLNEIKEELIDSGYIKRKNTNKKQRFKSKPYHFMSSDGFHLYVGKNNYQNDELTFHIAVGNDWWFHAKGIPGSHVIIKSEGNEVPDRTFEEAARLAAHFSKGKDQEKVEIDYTQKKNVKKPSGGKPGFVVYYTNYSLMIDTDISNIEVV